MGHFSRHILRQHNDEETVKKIIDMPIKSKERRNAFILLRRKGNFVLQREKNEFKPTRKVPRSKCGITVQPEERNIDKDEYSNCINCFGLFKNSYLWRHRKKCKSNIENTSNFPFKRNYRTEIENYMVSTGILGDFLRKSRLLEVFKIMRGDTVGSLARNDTLICLYGESLLGKHKRSQMYVLVSQKMREMAKIKKVISDTTTIKHLMDALKPELYEQFVSATKIIAGYNAETLSFRAPSLALNMGTQLKHLCHTALKAVVTKNPLFPNLKIDKKFQIQELKDMIVAHWCNDISSIAHKTLNENKTLKPKLLPLTEDVQIFNRYVLNLANQAYSFLEDHFSTFISKYASGQSTDSKEYQQYTKKYQTLSQCTLALVLTFNRKRIGEIQFLEIKTYEKESVNFNQNELTACLSEFEKLMMTLFKRVVVFGKGSKPVPILFTKLMQKFMNLLIKIRKSTNIVPKTNQYIFANPESDRWMNGNYVIRNLAKKCGAKQYELLTSNKFRKQIATILQLMHFEKDEMHQIAKFMGHTERTHMEFYRYVLILFINLLNRISIKLFTD